MANTIKVSRENGRKTVTGYVDGKPVIRVKHQDSEWQVVASSSLPQKLSNAKKVLRCYRSVIRETELIDEAVEFINSVQFS